MKVKDSKTLRRSIAHFYRDCQVWPRLQLDVILSAAPRPIQASTAGRLSVIGGGGNKLKLTAMLHRLTWIAGQRCYIRIWIGNETKKTVKTLTLNLIRTTILFKYHHEPDPDNDTCQKTITHKVLAETLLERSSPVAKNHASADGWWTGVQAGQEAYFSHCILLPVRTVACQVGITINLRHCIRLYTAALHFPRGSPVRSRMPSLSPGHGSSRSSIQYALLPVPVH